MLSRDLSVAVVVIRDYAAELTELAKRMPVWVIDTPANRGVVESLWRGAPALDVTVFSAAEGATADEACAGVLDMVKLHHPRCEMIRVFGAETSPVVCDMLASIGYPVIAESADGFIAAESGCSAGQTEQTSQP
jgi:hypothetical protein